MTKWCPPAAEGTRRNRGEPVRGTWMMARADTGRFCSSRYSAASSSAMSTRTRLPRRGNGCPVSTARGVMRGIRLRSKKSRVKSRCTGSRSSGLWMKMPSAFSRGTMVWWNSRCWRPASSWIRAHRASRSWRGVRPSGPGWVIPASIWRQMPATRTIKNSSQLLETMARNFTRSSRGTVGSSASSSTRSLKSSQANSRFR